MRLLFAVFVLGLCLKSYETLGRDDSESWATVVLQQAVVDDADDASEKVWNLFKDEKALNKLDHFSSDHLEALRLIQDSSLPINEELIASSAVPITTCGRQHCYCEVGDVPAIWITLAQRGLDYVKDVLLTEVLEAITPFPLPDVTRTRKIPLVGEFTVSFSNVTLVHAKVSTSTIALGDMGITMQGFDADANLTLIWRYSYNNIWLPEPVSDYGTAAIKVLGMQAGVAVSMQECSGTLCMNVLQCGTYIDDLEVQLKGESSWFYQWVVDVMEEQMRTTIEEQISEQIQEGVQNLNSVLLQTPQQVQVDGISELNFSVVSQPIITNSSISIGIKGQFKSPTSGELISEHVLHLPPGLVCGGDMRMATIALSGSILADCAAIHYNAELLNWLLDKLPDQTFLNTYKWRFLIPQLYQQYPNKELTLHFDVSAPPNVTLTLDGIDMAANAHMVIGVANDSSSIPVACISITAAASGLADLNGDNITGKVTLKDLNVGLEWSDVGKIHMTLVKVFLKTLVKDAVIPMLNMSLKRGLPLPEIPFMKLKDSMIVYRDDYLLICSDIEYVKSTSNLQQG